MFRLKGVRILHWLAGRSLGVGSKLLHDRSFFSACPSLQLFIGSSGVLCGPFRGTGEWSKNTSFSSTHYELSKKLHSYTIKDEVENKQSQEVQSAYGVLKVEEKHPIYDQVGPDAFSGFKDFDENVNKDEQFFRIISTQKESGKDILGILELSFSEAAHGCKKMLTFQADVLCQNCNVTGDLPGNVHQTCKACLGSEKDFCKSCNGGRVVKGIKSIELEVRPGVDNDEIITVAGGGGADPGCNRSGDLHIVIKVHEHPLFWRDGCDIHIEASISIIKAMKGGKIEVPTVNGKYTFELRPGLQYDQAVVLYGKGIKKWNSAFSGNQYIHFRFFTPINLTERQRMLMEEFKKEEAEFFWYNKESSRIP